MADPPLAIAAASNQAPPDNLDQLAEMTRLRRCGWSGDHRYRQPPLLSQTGVFSNLAALTPNAGVVDYEPNVAFWSDYAIKSRWFAIKNLTDTVGFSENGP